MSKQKTWNKWTEKQNLMLIEFYPLVTTRVLAKIFNRPPEAVVSAANRLGLKKPRAEVNKDYFKTWSHNMSYILGLLTADGNVQPERNSVRIALLRKDRYILEFMRDEISKEKAIYDFSWNYKGPNSNGEMSSLVITNREIVEDLEKLNVVKAKTGKEKMPDIPEDYIWSFILGYFDGDGSINFFQNGKPRIEIVCASKDFLLQLNRYLKFDAKIYERNSNYYKLYCGNVGKIIEIREKFYANNSHYLTRKKDRLDKVKHRRANKAVKGEQCG